MPTGPADQAPLVERGRALRDHALLRLLAVERGLRGIGLLLAAAAVILFSTRQASWRVTFEQALTDIRPGTRRLGVNVDTARLTGAIEHALHASPHAVIGIAAALAAYGALQLIEATGLWRARRWGEYVAVVGTSAFLPLEVYELVESVTALKAATLTLNIAAVAWLIWTKRLFGARGGHDALIAANRSASLLPSGPVPTD